MHIGRADRRTGARSRFAALTASFVAITTGAGCASYVHTPFDPHQTSPPAILPAATDEFTYVDGWPHRRYPVIAEDEHYRVRALEFPSVGENGQDGNLITGHYHEGKGGGAKPLVIVLPIWGIHDYPSDAMTAGLTERSGGAVNVLQILGERPLIDWQAMGEATSEAAFFAELDRMVDRFVDAVVDIRRLVDWAQTRPEIDRERIGLIGFSMSALVATVALAKEPRLTAGVLVMGGADLHQILAACDHEIEAARQRVLANLGWSVEHYEGELERVLAAVDPGRFARMVEPSRVLVIEAGADTCVPESARDRLWISLGRPERITYRYGHRMAFLAMTFLGGYDLQQHVYRFLDRTFGARDAGRWSPARGDGTS